jgi:cytochrome c553
VLQQVEQAGQPSRPRAPPTCTNCHEKGHKRRAEEWFGPKSGETR